MGVAGRRVTAKRFDQLYEESADPWNYRTSAYERKKYADTLASLPRRSYASTLEVGCSIGVFTRLLAGRCERLTAIDFSTRALSLARERLADIENVRLMRASFPEQAPPGPWELVVCSEVLYYLDLSGLERALTWLRAQLLAGSTVLVVSWRGPAETEPLAGDDVHDLLGFALARWHACDRRRPGYRIDRFDAHGA
jgi:predicted TPR repeat methyltransferase